MWRMMERLVSGEAESHEIDTLEEVTRQMQETDREETELQELQEEVKKKELDKISKDDLINFIVSLVEKQTFFKILQTGKEFFQEYNNWGKKSFEGGAPPEAVVDAPEAAGGPPGEGGAPPEAVADAPVAEDKTPDDELWEAAAAASSWAPPAASE